MLKEIKCSKFNQETITFKNGLNVVLGDQNSTNSIGKTTMLLIIDFVFAGGSYITSKKDAIENLGDHEFFFTFQFEGKEYYFCRATDNYQFIYICDSNYKKEKEISLDEFKNFLRDRYNLNYLDRYFRSIIGTYSRIWGKDNYYVDKPLKQKDSTMDIAINNMIKLFNKYSIIENVENQYKKVKGKQDAIKSAIKNELIPSINKNQYLKYQSELDNLNKKIDRFQKEMSDISLNLNSIVSEEIIELREEKSELFSERIRLENKIKRIEKNLKSEELNVNAKMDKLVEFFPTINIERLKEINDFHKKMSSNLKSELKEEIEKLEIKLEYLNNSIKDVEEKIERKLNIKDESKYDVERLADLLTKKNTLETINKNYENTQKNKLEVEKIKEDLNTIKNSVVGEISNSVNIEMYELFKRIYDDNRPSPNFNITKESYSLSRLNDTGTGSSYVNLIAFDLAIFEITELPIIIHDSILFKNIQLTAFDNLINIYSNFEKQIFIAIDEINRFSSTTQNILKDKSVISLNKQKTLFEMNWKVK